VSLTQPGTDMNVTPESEAPIIPYATTNQGDFLFPIKNDWLSALRAVIHVTAKSRMV
jgi:hypothetical protein